MKTLYLLRHANAAHPSGVDDEQRPLSGKGKKEAKLVGNHMQQTHIAPDVWLVSAAKRTQETCQYALRAGNFQNISPQFEEALYLASAGEMIARLNTLNDLFESAIIVGHNPGVEQLVKALCGTKGDPLALSSIQLGYPTGTLTEVSLEIDHWQKLEPGCGALANCFIAKH